MPSCKAKHCTVTRGEGISCFAIPDPKKNRKLCEKWIHNLGTENLNIKTFVYSKQNIVCAKHFEESCFKENLQATLLGYTPKYRYLKPDAVPTIFKGSKPVQKREFSEKRLEKKRKKELIDELLYGSENPDSASLLEDKPDQKHTHEAVPNSDRSAAPNFVYSEFLPRVSISEATEVPSQTGKLCNRRKETDASNIKFGNDLGKKKIGKRKTLRRKERKIDIAPTKVDIGIQVSVVTCDREISCDLPAFDDLPNGCVNCYAKDHPKIVMADHSYFRDLNSSVEKSSRVSVAARKKKITYSKETFPVPVAMVSNVSLDTIAKDTVSVETVSKPVDMITDFCKETDPMEADSMELTPWLMPNASKETIALETVSSETIPVLATTKSDISQDSLAVEMFSLETASLETDHMPVDMVTNVAEETFVMKTSIVNNVSEETPPLEQTSLITSMPATMVTNVSKVTVPKQTASTETVHMPFDMVTNEETTVKETTMISNVPEETPPLEQVSLNNPDPAPMITNVPQETIPKEKVSTQTVHMPVDMGSKDSKEIVSMETIPMTASIENYVPCIKTEIGDDEGTSFNTTFKYEPPDFSDYYITLNPKTEI